jgi:hypothetical protein
MFDDPQPKDIVMNPISGEECTVEEFNNMSKEEKKEWCNRKKKKDPAKKAGSSLPS